METSQGRREDRGGEEAALVGHVGERMTSQLPPHHPQFTLSYLIYNISVLPLPFNEESKLLVTQNVTW